MDKDYINRLEKTIILSVNENCDRFCNHCLRNKAQKTDATLPTKDLCEIIDRVAELNEYRNKNNSFHMLMSGGEPTKNPDLPELVAHAYAKGMNTVLSTTAGFFEKGPYYPTKEGQTAEGYIESMLPNGLFGFCFSLDGSTPEISIATTRDIKGDTRAYEGTIKAIDYCRKKGISFEVETIVQRANYEDVPNILPLAQGARSHRITNLMLRGCAEGKDHLKVSDDEFNALKEKYNLEGLRHFSLKRRPTMMLIISQSGKVYQEMGNGNLYIGNALKDGFEKILKAHADNYKKIKR